jgi:hypothetical protein
METLHFKSPLKIGIPSPALNSSETLVSVRFQTAESDFRLLIKISDVLTKICNNECGKLMFKVLTIA